MTSIADIYNRALSACGMEIGISDPGENSREAALCRLWYPTVRDNVLAAAPWPSVRAYARLARIRERDPNEPWQSVDPAPRYRFSYGRPDDLLHPYRMQSYLPFAFGRINGQRVFSSDEEAPILYYNARVLSPGEWEPNLALAVTHTLATYLALPLTGRSSRLQENAEMAFMMVDEAQTQAANAESEPWEVLPDWVQVRGYGNPQIPQFVYPMQSLNVARSS